MLKYSSVILAVLIILIIGFGFYNVIFEAVVLEPEAKKGDNGRILLNMKNVTNILASSDSIFNYIKKAIPYKEVNHPEFPPDENNWQEFVLRSIKINESAKHILILPGDGKDALHWAIPGIYYAKYYGSPVIFTEGNKLKPISIDFIKEKKVKVFVLANEDLISEDVLKSIPQEIKKERISGNNLYEHAVKINEYRDKESEFGWGRNRARRNGYFHFVIASPSDALKGLAALAFAKSNNASFLYVTDEGGIPAELDRYIFQQRADWFVTPSEGPFKHFWVLGNQLSYASLGRLDFSVEKAPYPSLGPVAFGPMEALLSVMILWGIAGAIFVLIHALRLLPDVMISTKIAWSFTAMLLPVIGVILYLSAYRRPIMKVENKMIFWMRPNSIQSASATAMGFGYGAPLMIAIGYLFVYYGFPLFFGESLGNSPLYFLGAGMPIMMIAMYVFAVLIAWPLVQMPMKEMMMDMDKKKIALSSLKVTALSMFAVSLGMMTVSWWMLMSHIPMMPHEDEILWFASMWMASIVGFFIAWPLNWPMVIKNLKPGGM